MICGGTISGNCAIGRPLNATRPPSTVTIAMTMATTGRRMKKRDIELLPVFRDLEWTRRDDGAIARGWALHHDRDAGGQPFIDHPAAADARPDLDRVRRHFVGLVDRADLIRALQLGDCALRHQQRRGQDLRVCLNATVLPWPQELMFVG